ncbi:4-(cytidine 5'-diphospho)-2-C-methyl-D-erythritol kinase [Neoaquamicrobium sediminum]|uniref:4-(cytidine 5'-diphospho)-2-C-methyl-D-erythritol kinase n=1 Tax=Neoaquamicrobium sediminum TaxID=1849104 RepID=UPI001563FECB|nr:4-(cytidine 5'-diphospho)-2-C-methyl-D-erythritol kinase [Mesorhizobium sediminum]NRC52410.1 4-(cytidine 5'-diphospho)-2-C-methyl-D-erythritol kinase [Mesorhizobium sediminum]
MPAKIVEHAPAKVNLALHVTGRRDDGYHLLDTLVVFTEVGDTVSVAAAEQDSFTIQGPFAGLLDDEADNLVLRARDLLRSTHGDLPPVAITLEKNLPVASGIGGGSSDAAATLRALMRLWGIELSADALAAAALRLGADLPMCLYARTLVARGIGEEIEPVEGIPPLHMMLANPGVAVPTPAIFRALASRENPPLPRLAGAKALFDWLAATRNDLQAPAIALAPEIGDVLSALSASGAALARMSGSGATCFGLFNSPADAEAAASAIAARYPAWYVTATRTIERARADAT